MKRKMLILRACGVQGEEQECDNIKSHAELYGIEVHDHCPKSNGELREILHNGVQYDYIYLSSHGGVDGFCNENMSVNYKWFDFGVMLCGSMCMEDGCIVMLSCCRSGLNQVAYMLFFCCSKISYIVGPRQDMYPNGMLIGFNILLFNIEHRKNDVMVACDKIRQGTDIRFFAFDRLEAEGELSYQVFKNNIDQASKNQLNEVRKEVNEPPVEE